MIRMKLNQLLQARPKALLLLEQESQEITLAKTTSEWNPYDSLRALQVITCNSSDEERLAYFLKDFPETCEEDILIDVTADQFKAYIKLMN